MPSTSIDHPRLYRSTSTSFTVTPLSLASIVTSENRLRSRSISTAETPLTLSNPFTLPLSDHAIVREQSSEDDSASSSDGLALTEASEDYSPSKLDHTLLHRRAASVPHHLLVSQPTLISLFRPLGILTFTFALSTTTVIYLVTTIPTLHLPHSLSDVIAQANELRLYSNSSSTAYLHVLLTLMIIFCYKQAFSSEFSSPLNVATS